MKDILRLIPLIAYLLFMLLIANGGGEYYRLTTIVSDHTNSHLLFGPRYSGYDKSYKYHMTMSIRPKTLVLGTSRSQQFRIEHFQYEDTSLFYNAGGIISNIFEIKPLLNDFQNDGYSPKKIILVLDQNFFNEEFNQRRGFSNKEFDFINLVNNKYYLYTPSIPDLFRDTFRLMNNIEKITINSENAIGLNAVLYQTGFRYDGSYKYMDESLQSEIFSCPQCISLEHILYGDTGFEYGHLASSEAVNELISIMEFSNLNQIELVLLFPPYAPSVWMKMIQTGSYNYISDATNQIYQISKDREVAFFNFSNLKDSEDNDFTDGYHGKENLYQAMARLINAEIQ
jgi:hypothetical protein